MILHKISVESFRTFTSHQEVDVDPRITILMGANESGKTNFLHAINCFSVDVDIKPEDISKSKTRNFARRVMPKISLTYLLDEADREKLNSFLPNSKDWYVISILKKGNGLNGYLLSIPPYNQFIMTQKGIEKINVDVNNIKLEIGEVEARIENAKISVADVEIQKIEVEKNEELDLLSKLDDEIIKISNEIEAYSNRLKGLEDKKTSLTEQISILKESSVNAVEVEVGLSDDHMQTLLNMIPKIKYIKEISFLPESIGIQELIEQQTSESLAVGNLLKIGEIDTLDILNEESRRVTPILRSTSTLISERLSDSWKQEKIDVNLRKAGENLVISILERVGVSSPPQERSEGFQWFLTFFANFMLESEENLKNHVLLFDEPALQLHPRGQKNFLEALEKISVNNQIIYTSHSPFLINKNFPLRIRILTKDPLRGSTVNNKPYSDGKSRYWEPLKSAIGVSLGDLFSIGEINFIVEGIADQILITGISHKLAEIGATFLDLEKITIVPGMGALCAAYLGTFCISEGLSAVVLLDNDSEGKRVKKRLAEQFPNLNCLLVNKYKKGAVNIEDLLPRSEYIIALNSLYNSLNISEYKEYEDKEEDNKKYNNVIKDINAHFKVLKLSISKASVAKEFIKNIHINDDSLENYTSFISMFSEINGLIPQLNERS